MLRDGTISVLQEELQRRVSSLNALQNLIRRCLLGEAGNFLQLDDGILKIWLVVEKMTVGHLSTISDIFENNGCHGREQIVRGMFYFLPEMLISSPPFSVWVL